ncbi:hypothetical protein GIB67_032287 [Kingdonia uniflora]|uniref:Uncharacterized protein n=1 Tax=Kingdonia uniflora TaxID=39325 RepID=A0A7J7MXA3_9MAGN|nr:hypothetical protein GIB67_032287 [Kingdonia uniflora]
MLKSPEDWNRINWSGGCTRRTPLGCQNGDWSLKMQNMKLPDTSRSWVNKSINHEECEVKCLRNCSCVAYSNSDITDVGSGCVMCFGDLVDIRQYTSNGQDFYLRMAASEQEYTDRSEKRELDFPTFSFLSIVTATSNFSFDNKLGEGGFGSVYKGKLANGKEIAVKRLSRTFGQGINEFIEVILIAKLQHRNLLGF